VNTNQRLKHLQVQFLSAAPIAEKSATVLFFYAKTAGSIPDRIMSGHYETRFLTFAFDLSLALISLHLLQRA